MKSIKGKLFFVYALIFIALSLTIISSSVAVDTSNQHLMLSELLSEQRLQVELVILTTINISNIRLIDEDKYNEMKDQTIEDIEQYKIGVEKVLEAFQKREYYYNNKIQALKFEGDFEIVFIKAVLEARKNWDNAYEEIQALIQPETEINESYVSMVNDFKAMNYMLISDVDLITKLCREEAERQKKISSLLQMGTLVLTLIIFGWLVYFVKKSIQDPIFAIRNVFKEMGSGNFDVSLEREADDEFQQLFEDFNRFIENKHVIGRLEDKILSEDNLRVVLTELLEEFNHFVELEKITISYTDAFENSVVLHSDNLNVTVVENIAYYEEIVCESPTTLIMPIRANQVYLGFATFYKRTAYSDVDIKFVSGLSNKVSFAFYKSLIFKDLLKIVTSGLADLTESRDPETKRHLTRMSMYSQVIAKRLFEKGMHLEVIDVEFIENILLAAPMHDIGKVAVPDYILLKPGKLTAEEFEEMKRHTCEGARVLKAINERFSKYNIMYFKMAQDIAHFHQEKFNGSGYPEQVAREQIPAAARICTVADVFDALTSKRPYKEAFSLEKSYSIIKESSGTHFDPDMVNAFFESQEEIEKIYYEYREV